MYLFFRSWRVICLPMIIVAINIIWTLGFISLFNFEITALTGIIPPLLVIIGVENSIFLINKYHQEYRTHKNKVLALSRSISRIGRANLLTNITTAIGFSAFIVTGNKILVEFGIVAAVSIVTSYLFTLILLPIFFSYAAAPKMSHTRHLDNKLMWRILEKAEYLVSRKRPYIYAVFLLLVFVSIFGVFRLKNSASIMDDVSHKSVLFKDMQFFESNFKGVLPLEIMIDTKKEKGVIRYSFLKKLDELNEELGSYKDLSKSLSILEVIKFGKQAYYNGDPLFYALPSQHEIGFMMDYMPSFDHSFKGENASTLVDKNKEQGSLTANPIIAQKTGIEGMGSVLRAYVDSNLQIARVGVQMKDLSTEEILNIKNRLALRLDEIFDTARYEVSMTGNSIVFLEGTEYLTTNLLQSLILAAVLIALMMFFLFSSWQMVLLAIIPNLLPQLITAAVMGYVGIPIKVSTILIFSVALGISVDNTIHFLSRYRMELRMNKENRRQAVLYALGEAGFSMLYSSIILFLGFSMFSLSSFGGTQWMGILVSLTLLV
ncbi:MAG: MMPL family transporter, partial [Bacteroidales bacterium]